MAQIAAPKAETTNLSFVDWSAVLAGAVLAAALSFVLLTFGTAIGLSATSPWPNSRLSAKLVASLAVFWTMAQQIGSVMAGGYVAGRINLGHAAFKVLVNQDAPVSLNACPSHQFQSGAHPNGHSDHLTFY